jgi:hypothetical protein
MMMTMTAMAAPMMMRIWAGSQRPDTQEKKGGTPSCLSTFTMGIHT